MRSRSIDSLIELFQGEKSSKGANALQKMRENIDLNCRFMFSAKPPFDEDTLKDA